MTRKRQINTQNQNEAGQAIVSPSEDWETEKFHIKEVGACMERHSSRKVVQKARLLCDTGSSHKNMKLVAYPIQPFNFTLLLQFLTPVYCLYDVNVEHGCLSWSAHLKYIAHSIFYSQNRQNIAPHRFVWYILV